LKTILKQETTFNLEIKAPFQKCGSMNLRSATKLNIAG
jgi:hypothetical protein